jgi:hypothetical protein
MSEDARDPAHAESSPPGEVRALVRDLLFTSRITAAARAANVPLAIVRNPADLAPTPARRLLVDLNLPGAIEAAAEWKRLTARPVTGFVSHVDTDTITRARAAGLDQVLARSRFVEMLPDLLA